MTDNTEIMDSYDDYDDDFDSGVPENDDGVIDSAQRTADETEAVAAILRGEDPGDITAKPNDSGARVRNVDGSGNVDYSAGESKAETAQEASIGNDTIYSQQVTGQMDQAQKVWDEAHKQNARLDEMLKHGEITQQQHYQATHQLGQMAGAAKDQMYQARIAQLEHGAQRDAQYKELETIGEDWSPENRQRTMEAVVSFAKSAGISDDVLRGVETKQEAEFIYNAMKNEQKVKELQLQLAGKSQKLREANRRLGRGRKQGQRASQIGSVDRQTAMIDEVAALLSQEPSNKGGRR